MLNKIHKLANQCRLEENYKGASVLCKIATDLALYEQKDYMCNQLIIAKASLSNLKKDLDSLYLFKLSSNIDVIAKDIENQIIVFSAEDPLQAVLTSYSLIHKLAFVDPKSDSVLPIVLQMMEDDSISDIEIIDRVKKLTLGLPLEDKKSILYVLDKEHNFQIPLDKIANSLKDKLKDKYPPSEQETKKIKDKIKQTKEESATDAKKKDEHTNLAFPSNPPMWGGFSYEAIVPYQQSSQLNFWSLASEEQKILSKIALIKK